MADTMELGSVEAARERAAADGRPYLVLDHETLERIEAAEAAGGFEGGMSGASGEGGFSAPGSGPSSSSASDPVPVELLDMEGAVPVGAFVEGLIEKAMDIKDVWEQFRGGAPGPVILVPKRELDRWLGIPGDGA